MEQRQFVSTDDAKTIEHPYAKKKSLDTNLTHFTKLNSKWGA